MISYDKSRKVWDFTQVSEDEKEALIGMAEAIWAKSMAYQIAMHMIETAPPPGAEYHDETEPSELKPMDTVVVPFPSKEKH